MCVCMCVFVFVGISRKFDAIRGRGEMLTYHFARVRAYFSVPFAKLRQLGGKRSCAFVDDVWFAIHEAYLAFGAFWSVEEGDQMSVYLCLCVLLCAWVFVCECVCVFVFVCERV